MSDSHVYVHCKKHHWVPARVVETKGDEVVVSIPHYSDEQSILSDGGKGAIKHTRKSVKLQDYSNEVLPLQNVDEMGWLNEEKDMVDLPFLHEAAILYNLKSRHVKGKPYTRTGDIVIAVNPYEWFHSLYTDKRRQEYASKLLWKNDAGTDPRRFLEPHVYETSALSYKGLVDGINQSVLVSGESGAGKTETVKICMNHIAMIQQGPGNKDGAMSSVVRRVVESNPLLEAFGNAKTSRNDNSSRFGKYLQLQFTVAENSKATFGEDKTWEDCKLAGSQSDVYLLEKSRVVHHADSERTFHIFYQLLESPDSVKSKFWPKLEGKNADSFSYVGRSETNRIEGKTDAEHFQDTLSALALVGVDEARLETLMHAIIAVLQLGNMGFQGCEDKSQVSTQEVLHDLAGLMGVPSTVLASSLTQRTMQTTGDSVKVHLNVETAKEACDALAKAIYQEAFMWLVREINSATKAENNNSDYSGEYGIIGLLDIFGFERFRKNGFEQLCINYANERLQQKFTEDIFRQVQAEYKYEGLALDDIRYDDNQNVLDLVESRMGLLAMLNEECVRPKGNDREFVYKAIRENRSSVALIVEKTFSPYEFGVRHYAGDVLYTAENFVTKNSDTLPMDLRECAGLSKNQIIAGIPKAVQPPAKTSNLASRRSSSTIAAYTVWTKYKHGLSNLMANLRKTNSRYIRCIKPNEMKLPAVMQHGPTLDQLRSAGVIAAVTITRSAFPNRLDHESVLERFKHLAQRALSVQPGADIGKEVEKLLALLLEHLETSSDGQTMKPYAIGKTRTYFRAGALEFLEAQRIKGFDPAAAVIQKVARGFLVRKRKHNEYISTRDAATTIQSLVRVLLAKAKARRSKKAKKEKAEHSAAATIINATARGVVRRMRFRDELRHYREVTAMKAELSRLQEKVEESERLKTEAVSEAEERVRSAMELIREEKSQASSNSAEALETAKLLEERNNMIEKMRSGNKRVRANIKLLEGKFKRLREELKRKQDENEKETERFFQLNNEARAINEANSKAVDNQGIWKKQVLALRDEMQKIHSAFDETSQSRVKYQNTMAEILKMLRTRCKQEQLIEDTIMIALESDTEAKALKASFDAVQAHMAEKERGASAVPDIIGRESKNQCADHTDTTESASEMEEGADDGSTLSSPELLDDDDSLDIDEEEFERQEAEMEAEFQALSAEVGL